MFVRRMVMLLGLLALGQGCADDPGPTQGADGAGCGPGGCAGCCQGSVCVVAPTASACGASGSQCVSCSSGQTCQFGKCVKHNACGASNCTTGCCRAGRCMPGSSDDACGKGGDSCSDCTVTALKCTDQRCGGGTQPCGASTCNGGCCAGGKCQAGTVDLACGKGGVACVDCKAAGKTCEAASQTCKGTTPSCSATTCAAGCCQGGACMAGNTDSACGKGGASCADCKAAGKTCDSATSACSSGPTTCDATSCPLGCCQGGGCKMGTTESACGQGGAPCASCMAWEICGNGTCKLSTMSKWQVTLVSATVNKAKTWDSWAIGSYRNPDLYAGLSLASPSCSSSGVFKCTPTKANTHSASWNHSLGTMLGLLLKSPCLMVADEDSTTSGAPCPTGFEAIGVCAPTITPADLVQGGVKIYSCPNPKDGKNYVTSLELSFKHVP